MTVFRQGLRDGVSGDIIAFQEDTGAVMIFVCRVVHGEVDKPNVPDVFERIRRRGIFCPLCNAVLRFTSRTVVEALKPRVSKQSFGGKTPQVVE